MNSCNDCNSNCNPEIQELPPITGGFLNITQKCNLKCKYCFVVQQPIDMTLEVAKDATDFYVRNALGTKEIPSINFFGGEPLLRWDDIIVPLTEYVRKKYGFNFELSMTSNGILLDREKLEYMKKNKIGLLFSIDGDEKTQNLNRPFHNGSGSFDILKEKIKLILEYHPNMTFRATVDHDNIYDMADNFQFAIDNKYTNAFMIPNVFAEWNEEEVEELRNQVKLIGDKFMNLLREGKLVEFSHFSDAFKQFNKINQFDKSKEFRTIGDQVPGNGRCGIGATKFASIGHTGNIYSCQELVENPDIGDAFKIGNIYTGIDDNKRREIIEKFKIKEIKRSDGKSCDSCILNNICNGGCLINNYFVNNDMNIMPSLLCDYQTFCIEECIRIMGIMAEEKNEMFKEYFLRVSR